MVLQSYGVISEGQIPVDASQGIYAPILDATGTYKDISTYLSGTFNTSVITGIGQLPPAGEYAMLFATNSLYGNYISFTDSSTLNISWGNASVYTTCECWINPTTYNASNGLIFGKCGPLQLAALDWSITLSSNGNIILTYNTVSNGQQVYTTSSTIPLNKWSHITFCYSSPNFYIGINGVVVSIALVGTITNNSSGNYFTIGQYNNTTRFIGYMTCIRVMSGSSASYAVYTTATYIPPIYPLTKIAGAAVCVILRANAKYIVDASGNIANPNMYASGIINGGVTYINTPLAPIYGSLSSTTGLSQPGYKGSLVSTPPACDGALYFNGLIGSYITNTSSVYNFAWSAGFTLEFWANFLSFPSGVSGSVQPSLIGNFSATSSTTPWWAFGPNASGQLTFWYASTPSNKIINISNMLAINTWYHLAITSNGTNIYIFINGVLQLTSSISSASSINSTNFTIGQYNNTNAMNCLLSNIRLVGGTALYTASFIPSSGPLILASTGTTIACIRASPYITDTTSRFSFTNGQYLYGGICAVPNPTQVGVPPPSGEGVIYLPGIRNSYLTFENSVASTYGFTLEFFVNYISFTNEFLIGDYDATSSSSVRWYFGATSTGAVRYNNYNNSIIITTAQQLTTNKWYHIALVYNPISPFLTQIYINGQLAGSASQSAASFSNTYFSIGGNQTYFTNAYISNVRITQASVAANLIYTSQFTVPNTIPLGISTSSMSGILLRVPPIEIPLSQTSLNKSRMIAYRANQNTPQIPLPGALIWANSNGVSLGYTNTTNIPQFDAQKTNSIIFDGATTYLSLPTLVFTPVNGFSIVLIFTLSSNITIGATLLLIGDNAILANYIKVVYTSANTLTIFVSTAITVNINVATNILYNIVLTYKISTNTFLVYVNNVLYSTTTSAYSLIPIVSSYTINYLGRTPAIAASYAAFSCTMFALYNRSFTTTDVATYFTGMQSNISTNSLLPMGSIIDVSLPMNEIIEVIGLTITSGAPTSGTNASFTIATITGVFYTASIIYSYNGSATILSGLSSNPSTAITSLNANAAYTFTAVPFNSSGISNGNGVYTTTVYTLPLITGLVVYAVSSANNTITINWAGNGSGSYFSYATVSWSPATTGSPTTLGTGVYSFTTPGNLSPTTFYTFTVTPYNVANTAGTPVPLSNAIITPSFAICYYNFYNAQSWNGSGTTITDLSGRGNNLTLSGNATYSTNYVAFTGGYAKLSSEIIPSFITSGITIEILVQRTANTSGYQRIFGIDKNGNFGDQTSFSTSADANSVYLSNYANGTQVFNGNMAYPSTWSGYQWSHIIFTITAWNVSTTGTVTAYLNGTQYAQQTFTNFSSTTNNVYIGMATNLTNGGGVFIGNIGMARIYNYAISSTQVTTNYNALTSLSGNPYLFGTPLAVSSITSGTITSSSVILNFTLASGATSYTISSTPIISTNTGITASGYRFNGLNAGIGYTFTITSVNASGNGGSLISGTITTLSPAVSSITAGTITSSTIVINFTAATGATSYQITSTPTTITQTTTALSYTFTGLSASTSYTVTITSINASGNGGSYTSGSFTTSAASTSRMYPSAFIPQASWTASTPTYFTHSTFTYTMSGQAYGNGQYICSADVDSGYQSYNETWLFDGKYPDLTPQSTDQIRSYNNFNIVLQLPTAIKLSSYFICGSTYDNSRWASSWTLYGSNDGTTYTSLDTQSGQAYQITGVTYTTSQSTAYSYYKFNPTSITSLKQWLLYGSEQVATPTITTWQAWNANYQGGRIDLNIGGTNIFSFIIQVYNGATLLSGITQTNNNTGTSGGNYSTFLTISGNSIIAGTTLQYTITVYNAINCTGLSATASYSNIEPILTPLTLDLHFNLVDVASGNYVCYNGNNYNMGTAADAIVFSAYNNSAVYNNSSGGVALQTYSGKNANSLYMRHASFICWSQTFTSNNYDFAWLFNSTSTNGIFTIYNWYGGGCYLDIVNNYLQITNTARQWQVIQVLS
jgi:hypothetical protein